ncbi:hypothetical protein [Legionella sp. 16cNR16C]|uniref:hypothetical protein n=1 Tax=Legionella sp. 16cNR16C TaxID=2905656 RepID=UPI001E308833|nr:hypothetical protein [Legionella sp. 16cNR16C]MCE3046074.1 hypothetical protein [Legionella sp. 16cNR16C]
MQSTAIIQAALTKDKEHKVLSENDYMVSVFKKALPNSRGNVLNEFVSFLEYRRSGTWLLRESRTPGMITLSFVILNQPVKHQRYAYCNNEWVIVTSELIEQTKCDPSFKPHYKETLEKKETEDGQEKTMLSSLLDKIFTKFPEIVKDRLLLPTEEQASSNSNYIHQSPYINWHEKAIPSPKKYVEPLKGLDKAMSVLRMATGSINYWDKTKPSLFQRYQELTLPDLKLFKNALNQPFPYESGIAKDMKDLFSTWLQINRLEEDLFCPVEQELFSEPYVLESGYIFNSSVLYHNGKHLEKCPITRKEIEQNPSRLKGYRSKLAEALLMFYDGIAAYQKSQSTFLPHQSPSENEQKGLPEVDEKETEKNDSQFRY